MDNNIKKITGLGLLTAIVIVLQVLAVAIRPTGFFNISLVLIPIVVGGALYGKEAGAWLGFVFSAVVLLTDASAFLAISVLGTIITVIVKGTLAGYCAGLICELMKEKNTILAVILSAIACPIVNTGVFLIGCRLFFMETINQWAQGAGYASAGTFMIIGLVGINFLIEMGINIVISPAVVQIVKLNNKR